MTWATSPHAKEGEIAARAQAPPLSGTNAAADADDGKKSFEVG